jgi:hypothetical protein
MSISRQKGPPDRVARVSMFASSEELKLISEY